MRIAFAQLSSESDDFTGRTVDLEFVQRTGYLLRGSEIGDAKGLQNEIAGAVNEIEARHASLVGLIGVRANSGGPFDASLHRQLTRELLTRLTDAGPVDGVLLSLHGSMVTQRSDDPDGELVSRVRRLVGRGVPIAVTLDLHANITHRLIANADIVTAYKNYPHTDLAETGARGAHLLLAAAAGDLQPTTVGIRIPWVGSAINASTRGDGEFAQFCREARARIGGSVADTSILQVGCWTDVREYGSSVLVVADGNPATAQSLAQSLALRYWAIRRSLDVETVSVQDAVARSTKAPPGPVLLLDTADTTGGGASGDSVHALKGLLELGVREPTLATVVDPDAAAVCSSAGVGSRVSLSVGHGLDPRWGSSLNVDGVVERAGESGFTYAGGLFAGRRVSMGMTALVRVGSAQILVCSNPLYEFGDEHYRALGLDVSEYRFVIVKNMMNFREALAPKSAAWFVLDCPGPTPADYRALPYQRPIHPLEPFDTVEEPQMHLMVAGSSWSDCPDPRRPVGRKTA